MAIWVCLRSVYLRPPLLDQLTMPCIRLALFLPLQVRSYLMEAGRLHAVRQVLINTSEDAFWNLMSSSSNIGGCCTHSQPSVCDGEHVHVPCVREVPRLYSPAQPCSWALCGVHRMQGLLLWR